MKKFYLLLVLFFPFVANAQTCSSCNPTAWTTTVQAGINTTYSVPAVSGATYFWATGLGLPILSGQGTNSVTVQANSTGALYVTRYTSTSACANTAQITVVPPPATPSSVTISVSPCSSITATVTAVTNATSYRWYIDGSLVTTTSSTSLTLSSSTNPNYFHGVRNLCVEALNQYGVPSSGRACQSFSGCPPSAPSLGLAVNGCTSITVSVTNSTNISSFNWYINGTLFTTTTPAGGSSSIYTFTYANFPALMGSNMALCVEAVDVYSAPSSRSCVSFNSCVPPTVNSILLATCTSITVNVSNVQADHYNWYVNGTLFTTTPPGTGNSNFIFQFTDFPNLLIPGGGKTSTVCVESADNNGHVSQTRSCGNFTPCNTGPAVPSLALSVNGCTGITVNTTNPTNVASFNWYVNGNLFTTTTPSAGSNSAYVFTYANFPSIDGGANTTVCVEAVNHNGIHSVRSCVTYNSCALLPPTVNSVSLTTCTAITVNVSNVTADHYNWYVNGNFFTSTPASSSSSSSYVFLFSDYPILQLPGAGKTNSVCAEAVDIYGHVSQARSCGNYLPCGNVSKISIGPSIFPNPSTREITISLDEKGAAAGYDVGIFDQTGTRLKSFTSNKTLETIDVSDLPRGNFVIRLTSGSSTVTKQIVLQ